MNWREIKKIISTIKSDGFVSNSSILFCGSFLVGVINYFYQLLMARLLSISDYGELQSIFALISLVGVLTATLSIVITKYTADYNSRNQITKVRAIFGGFSQKALIAGAVIFIITGIFSGRIAHFLNMYSIVPIIIAGVSPAFGFPAAVNTAILSGLHKFKAMSIISVSATLAKIIFAVVLVSLGFALNGAIAAVVLAAICGYIISFYPIKFLFKMQSSSVETKEMFKYSLPAFFSIIFTSLLLNANVILVKHYFSAQVAGEYGALVVLGNLIYFLVGPISSVMFPMAAHAHGNQGRPAKVLKKAVALVVLLGGAAVGAYFIFHRIIITLLIGGKFASAGTYLGWFGLSMLSCSLVALIANYFLSIGKTRGAYLVGLGALAQIALIVCFHSSMNQIIWIMNLTAAFTVVLLAGYFVKIYYLCPKN